MNFDTLPVYTFRSLSNKQYGALRSRYINNPGKTVEDWWSFAMGAIQRAVENSDASHINDLLICAGNEEKIRDTRKVLVSVGIAKMFTGNLKIGFAIGEKMTAAQKKARTGLLQSWESDFSLSVMELGVKKSAEFSEENYIAQILTRAEKNGLNVVDFASHLLKAAEKKVADAAEAA